MPSPCLVGLVTWTWMSGPLALVWAEAAGAGCLTAAAAAVAAGGDEMSRSWKDCPPNSGSAGGAAGAALACAGAVGRLRRGRGELSCRWREAGRRQWGRAAGPGFMGQAHSERVILDRRERVVFCGARRRAPVCAVRGVVVRAVALAGLAVHHLCCAGKWQPQSALAARLSWQSVNQAGRA